MQRRQFAQGVGLLAAVMALFSRPTVAQIRVFPGEQIYRAVLSQTGTSDPTATVLKNTLVGGKPTFLRYNVGAYIISLVGAFPAGRIWMHVSKATLVGITSDVLFYRSDDDTLTLETQAEGVSSDEVLSNTSIEIAVYPE